MVADVGGCGSAATAGYWPSTHGRSEEGVAMADAAAIAAEAVVGARLRRGPAIRREMRMPVPRRPPGTMRWGMRIEAACVACMVFQAPREPPVRLTG